MQKTTLHIPTRFTLKCIDNSGVYYDSNDREFEMSEFLTVGKLYRGSFNDSGFLTIDDIGDTGVFDPERFVYA